MSFNFEKIGRVFATIDGGKFDGKIVAITTPDADEQPTKAYVEIPLKDGKYQQIPNINAPKSSKREILYITGPSGSGKSTYTLNYIKQYKKKYTKNEVWLFSALTEDETIDKCKPKRILIDDRLVTEPLEIKDFEDSLCIFDDVDVIKNKDHREAVYGLLNAILETGRHFNISCIITNHLPTAGKDTRRVINECHSVTYFPQAGSAGQMKRLLQDYLGLDNATTKKIRKLNTRWATIFKNFPMCVMTERLVFSLNPDDDDDESIE
jgi:energy-coupling factor transporter ATP-binding protein EcfA2